MKFKKREYKLYKDREYNITITDTWKPKTCSHDKFFLSLELLNVPDHDVLVWKIFHISNGSLKQEESRIDWDTEESVGQ